MPASSPEGRRLPRAPVGSGLAEGSISSSSNSYPIKDGTRRKAKPHWKFQSLGARGKRKYKNIPESLVPRVRKLVANDFMHAAGYLNTCCEKLAIPDAANGIQE